MIRAYHFVGATLRDGSPIPPDGKWLVFDGKPVLCEQGLHGSEHPFDALRYAPGNTLCLVDLDGEIDRGDDKLCATKRRIVKRIDAEPLLREFARWCASQVLHLWDAPNVVKQYFATGDESLRAASWAAAGDAARAAARDDVWDAAREAAWAAAWDATWAAARDAAWVAAWGAARDAARAAAWGAAAGDDARDAEKQKQRDEFKRLVDAAFNRSE